MIVLILSCPGFKMTLILALHFIQTLDLTLSLIQTSSLTISYPKFLLDLEPDLKF